MPQLPKDRYDDNIKTRNFRLKRTSGTRTKFTLDDKRTGISIGFDAVVVGMEMGRGDTVQFRVEDEACESEMVDGPRVASIYQHDVSDYLLDVLRHVASYEELPEADYLKDSLDDGDVEGFGTTTIENADGDGDD